MYYTTRWWGKNDVNFQVGDGFNRDYWARFERWARSIVRRADEVFIATGPVFAPKFTPDGLRSHHGYIGTLVSPLLFLIFFVYI